MSREITPFPVRLHRELRERLEASAKEAGRSLNTEIADRLELSFSRYGYRDVIENRISEYERLGKEAQDALVLANGLQAKLSDILKAGDPNEALLIKEQLEFVRADRALLLKIQERIAAGFNEIISFGYQEGIIHELPTEDQAADRR